MHVENSYRSMNESILPDRTLIEDTLARMERGEAPKRRPRRLRRIITLSAAAAVAAGCITPALATHVPAVYQALYAISPAVTQALMPVHEACEKNGVRMEVVSAAVTDDTVAMYLALTDTNGSLFGTRAPAFSKGWTLNSPVTAVAATDTMISYDAQTHTAVFYLELTYQDIQSFPNGKYTFSLPALLIGRNSQDMPIPIDLASVPSAPPTEQHICSSVATAGDSNPYAQTITANHSYDFLQPQKILWQSDDGIFSLAAIGYRDGQLHLLCSTRDKQRCANRVSFMLDSPDGTPITPDFVAAYFSPDGTDRTFEEWAFPISYGLLPRSSLTGWLRTSSEAIEGNWQVTFRLESN